MRYKLTFTLGLGIGYVFGTRAGRQRYEQIMRAFRGFKDNPTVQETAGVVQAQANDLLHVTRDRMSDRLSHSRVGERMHAMAGQHDGSSTYGQSAGSNGMS